jgi:hypothetical protein
MRPTLLALTDGQLEIVLEAAAAISPAWRSRLLENIADQLLGAEVTDDAVHRAVAVTLERFAA